jgi:Fe-S cluster biogenesis protein NfuA/nitrite reductase/ring-hydroxylating ferredoxin subunit
MDSWQPMHQPDHPAIDEAERLAAQIEAALQELDALPYPAVREQMYGLLQAIDGLHRLALHRFVGLLREQDVEIANADPLAGLLLRMYDIVPTAPAERVEAALDSVRPYIHSHGGAVELVDVVDGVVHLRLSGACVGCPASEITLHRRVEAAIREAYPEFAGIRLHDTPQPADAPAMPGFIPLADITVQRGAAPPSGLRPIASTGAVPPGTTTAFDLDGVWVLVANIAGEFFAASNTCPGSRAPLHLGVFAPPIVVCPWHNDTFDVRSGRRVDGQPGEPLETYPVVVRDGTIHVAIRRDAGATAGMR